MPNIVAHYICGKLVAKKLNITSNDFIKGNLIPDYIDKRKHYRVKGEFFEVPDLDKFMSEEHIKNKLLKLGFLTHLMLDKLFLDSYVIENIYSKIDKSTNIFEPDKIYTDYTNISNLLLKYYGLNLDDIDDIMLNSSIKIDIEKYKSNTDVIRTCNSGYLKYLDPSSFISFLVSSSDKISEYVKKKKYI